MRANICFDCRNGYPSKCIKILYGNRIYKGTVISNGVVVSCPNFVPDTISLTQLARILKISTTSFYKLGWERARQRLLEEGYDVTRVLDGARYVYFMKGNRQ